MIKVVYKNYPMGSMSSYVLALQHFIHENVNVKSRINKQVIINGYNVSTVVWWRHRWRKKSIWSLEETTSYLV